MKKVTIVNVVATATLNQEVDLFELAQFREILHDPEIYCGRVAYFKSPTMKGKVTIFPSGKLISVGTKSEKEAAHELALLERFLVEKDLVKPVKLQPKIQNIVATGQLDESPNLEELAVACHMIYEPEQFPGGILKIEEPFKTTILVFASGKFVITGLKSSTQIKPTLQALTDLITACSSERSAR